MRAIVWAIIAYLLFSLTRRWRVSQTSTQRVKKQEGAAMVSCTTCGTYVVVSEAVVASGRYYCSTPCREA